MFRILSYVHLWSQIEKKEGENKLLVGLILFQRKHLKCQMQDPRYVALCREGGKGEGKKGSCAEHIGMGWRGKNWAVLHSVAWAHIGTAGTHPYSPSVALTLTAATDLHVDQGCERVNKVVTIAQQWGGAEGVGRSCEQSKRLQLEHTLVLALPGLTLYASPRNRGVWNSPTCPAHLLPGNHEVGLGRAVAAVTAASQSASTRSEWGI